MEENKKENGIERCVAVSVITDDFSAEEAESSFAELERLIETAGGTTVGILTQNREAPDVRTYIGSGKVGELFALCEAENVDNVIFDAELSPIQIRNLEDELKRPVIDRTMLILDIFALHASTGEGKIQVELAQLRYTAPRLIGKGKDLSRLGGGIGTRGPGESKLETDKRHLKRRIAALELQAKEIEKNRMTNRAARGKSAIPKIAVVGYTNAGKSTLMNKLTDAGILAQDKLFATLDPTTRKYTLPSGKEVLLTDTVGFIRRLPHQLVKAFKSTLEEALYADIILLITDAADPEYRIQLETTEKTLSELGITGKPFLYVFNKCDKIELPPLFTGVNNAEKVFVSALTGEGLETLTSAIERIINNGKEKTVFRFPLNRQADQNRLYSMAEPEAVIYSDEYTDITVLADEKTRNIFREYIIG